MNKRIGLIVFLAGAPIFLLYIQADIWLKEQLGLTADQMSWLGFLGSAAVVLFIAYIIWWFFTGKQDPPKLSQLWKKERS